MSSPRGLAILGSTGSIGRSALDVVARNPGKLRVVALAAGRNIALLAEQVQTFSPALVSVQRAGDVDALRERLAGLDPLPQLCHGADGLRAVAGCPEADVVLTAVVGAVGLSATLTALERGITVAIANKEPLAAAGRLCMDTARENGATVVPVDSEHNAIYQCLQGHRGQDLERILLTGSGGPFRQTPAKDLARVTVEQALAHPNWSMGPKITVDSATLMNKGLEVMEARWLFDVSPETIEVLIHPQSIIHSMVRYTDGAVLAHMGPPDMRGAISHALGFPARLDSGLEPLDFSRAGPLTFEPPDPARFPALDLAYQALAAGGTAPAALNAANEVAVEAFLQRRIGYLEIAATVRAVLEAHRGSGDDTLDQILDADAEARRAAGEYLGLK